MIYTRTAKSSDLETAETDLQRAAVDLDIVVLEKLIVPEVLVGLPDGSLVDRDRLLRLLQDGPARLTEVREESRSTRRFGDAGSTRSVLVVKVTNGGEEIEHRVASLHVWKFEDESWSLVDAQHTLDAMAVS